MPASIEIAGEPHTRNVHVVGSIQVREYQTLNPANTTSIRVKLLFVVCFMPTTMGMIAMPNDTSINADIVNIALGASAADNDPTTLVVPTYSNTARRDKPPARKRGVLPAIRTRIRI
jgi:hypothetical protein